MKREFLDIVENYKSDGESVFNTWFINNGERLKAFRSIRRGVEQVVDDIRTQKFGNDYRDSSLEFVLNCITEQKQVFIGAAHAFYWKPKLRIPDIYENDDNKRAFGQFLEKCLNANSEDQLIKQIILLDRLKIKGLGPAVANILYFLHPELMPPCNTAIVNGFNTLFGERVKLGSWPEYLRMRETILARNRDCRAQLSRDLGAFSGLLFDIGIKKIMTGTEGPLSDDERKKIERTLKKRHREVMDEKDQENLHSEMQYHLLKIGDALGYDVISAANDRSRCHDGHSFSKVSRYRGGEGHQQDNFADRCDLVQEEHQQDRLCFRGGKKHLDILGYPPLDGPVFLVRAGPGIAFPDHPRRPRTRVDVAVEQAGDQGQQH